jgi:hypothetical protein
MQGSLLTNVFIGYEHLTIDTTCHRCGTIVEDDIHTCRDCPSDMSIWRSIHLNKLSDFLMQYCRTWFKHHDTLAL